MVKKLYVIAAVEADAGRASFDTKQVKLLLHFLLLYLFDEAVVCLLANAVILVFFRVPFCSMMHVHL